MRAPALQDCSLPSAEFTANHNNCPFTEPEQHAASMELSLGSDSKHVLDHTKGPLVAHAATAPVYFCDNARSVLCSTCHLGY